MSCACKLALISDTLSLSLDLDLDLDRTRERRLPYLLPFTIRYILHFRKYEGRIETTNSKLMHYDHLLPLLFLFLFLLLVFLRLALQPNTPAPKHLLIISRSAPTSDLVLRSRKIISGVKSQVCLTGGPRQGQRNLIDSSSSLPHGQKEDEYMTGLTGHDT